MEALRCDDVATLRRRDMPTPSELVDEYLAQQVCEENTKATARLKYASATFDDV